MKIILILCLLLGISSPLLFGQPELQGNGEPLLLTLGEGKKQINILGYKADAFRENEACNAFLADSVLYVNGFRVMAADAVSLFAASESDTYGIRQRGDSLEMDRILNLPVGKKMMYCYVPVIRYYLVYEKDHWILSKPFKVLNTNWLTDEDMFRIRKDLGWDRLKPELMFPRDRTYPERRLTNAFVVSMKYFPVYNADFRQLEKGDGYVAELYQEYNDILKLLE